MNNLINKLLSSRRLWAAAGAAVFVRLAWVGSMDAKDVMLVLGVIVTFLFKRDGSAANGNGNNGQ